MQHRTHKHWQKVVRWKRFLRKIIKCSLYLDTYGAGVTYKKKWMGQLQLSFSLQKSLTSFQSFDRVFCNIVVVVHGIMVQLGSKHVIYQKLATFL